MSDWIAELVRRKDACWKSLRDEPSGLGWSDYWAETLDFGVKEAMSTVQREHPALRTIALVATGSFGRRDLSPLSDMDIVVVPLDEQHEGLDHAIRKLFALLQEAFVDGLGLRLDQAYRLVADAPSLDPKSRTALLEARLVAGSNQPLDRLMDAFWADFPIGDFLIGKIQEREVSVARTNDTPLVVAPNLKEGAGGLRDFHAANWIRQAIGEREQRPSAAVDAVQQARNLLHLIRPKVTETLSPPAQVEIAGCLGFDHRQWMGSLHSAMLELRRGYLNTLDRVTEARFELSEGVLAVRGDVRITPGVSASAAAVGVAAAVRLGLRVLPMPVAVEPEVNGSQALHAIGQGEKVLRALDDCHVLSALLPELVATRTLLPDDSSHRFTVMEHTLRTVRNLEMLARSSNAVGGALSQVHDKPLLLLAALLHDVGKIHPTEGHCIAGEALARQVADRWGLDSAQTEDLAWLVRHHLDMSHAIRMRDIQHPETVSEFAQLVGCRERLAMLTALTWADTNAVAPDLWTPIQDSLLKELYERADRRFLDEQPASDPEHLRRVARKQLADSAKNNPEVQAFADLLPAHYLLSTPTHLLSAHFEHFQSAFDGATVIVFDTNAQLNVTDLTLCQLDKPGLLSRVLGVLHALDISVIGVRACTARSSPPVALDVFSVAHASGPLPPATCAVLRNALLRDTMSDEDVDQLLAQKGKQLSDRKIGAHVHALPGVAPIVEARGPRGSGLAFRASRIIAQSGWNILSARAGQWAGQSTASFTLQPGAAAKSGLDELVHALKTLV